MKIWNYPSDAHTPLCDCVLALGFFDGVHLAHRRLMQSAKEEAKALGLPLIVFTFPQQASIKRDAPRIYSTEQKLELLEICGAEGVILCDFDHVKDYSADEFINKIIIGFANARVAVCGFNFKFGKGALGNCNMLLSRMEEAGRKVVALDEYTFMGETLSSTYIRRLLANGDALTAAKALGLPYFIDGTVCHGRGKGKEYGVPTVNISFDGDEPPLKYGVYESLTLIDGKYYTSLTNVGICPSFGARECHMETFILDFSKTVYEKPIRIYLLSYIREEMIFCGQDEFKNQIKKDTELAYARQSERKWQEIGLSLP